MRNMRVTHLVAGALTIALLAALAAAEEPEAAAEANGPKPWNQEEMADLTSQFSRAMRDVRQAYRREPVFRDSHSPNRRAAMRLDEILRSLETAATQLRNRVNNGDGVEETRGIARRIGMLLNDADVEGRRIMTSTFLDQRLQPAMVLINQIAPFYGSAPLFDPETMQRLDRPPNASRRQAEE
jgi:hypothetical protein